MSYTITSSHAFQFMAYMPWPCSYLTTPAFLLALCDLGLRGFISVIMVLSTISHIYITADPPPSFWFDIMSSHLSRWYVFACMNAIYVLNALSCLTRSVSMNISSRWPEFFTICSLGYCSAVIGIFHMCLVLQVITLSIFITLTLYGCLLWSMLLPSTITQCTHGPPSSLCIATIGPMGKEIESLWISLFLKYLSCCNLRA